MPERRTDLACEARELWRERTGALTEVPGVRARTYRREGFAAERVEILNAEGAAALGRGEGTYVSLSLAPAVRREPGSFPRAVHAVARELRPLLPPGEGCVLVACLGNRAVTPDAVGPCTARSLLVTRHLTGEAGPLSALRPVAVFSPGVLAESGVESAALVRAAVRAAGAQCVLAVDALASRALDRVCTCVELTDTGIRPGSGVGNSRAELSRATLGVPVIAVGAPTVVDAATLCADLTGDLPADRESSLSGVFVTPREIDSRVEELGRILGWGITLALQSVLTFEELAALLA